MYSIVLTNGIIVNIKASEVEWCEKDRMIKLFKDGRVVARVNMDNVVGWISVEYFISSAQQERSDKECRIKNGISS